MKARRITCADLIREDGKGYCRIIYTAGRPRCIDVSMNVCRMKPIDVSTGKPVRRKFVIPKEGVTACWWKEVKNSGDYGKRLLLQKDRKTGAEGLPKRRKV